MKKYLIIAFVCSSVALFGQWNIATGAIDWTPNNSAGMPAAYFYHAVQITASANLNIIGGGSISNNYPLCTSPLTMTISLSGGASFVGANASDAVSTSGDWEGRFSWTYFDASHTTIVATQINTIPTGSLGSSNVFTYQVLTPNYSSNFVIQMQLQAGAGGSQCSGTSKNPNTSTGDDAESTDGFTLRSLPIQSLDFKSIDKKENAIQLSWKTLNEVNTLEFEVERKYSNEDTWMSIGKTPAAGQSNKELIYSYSDANYAQRDKIYYRIKQVDVDGAFNYTDIKSIDLKKNSSVKLDGYPNPVKDLYHLTITGIKDDKVSIDVFDILGRSVSRQSLSIFKGANYHDLNLGSYSPGTYIVRVSSGEINESMTVVKVE